MLGFEGDQPPNSPACCLWAFRFPIAPMNCFGIEFHTESAVSRLAVSGLPRRSGVFVELVFPRDCFALAGSFVGWSSLETNLLGG